MNAENLQKLISKAVEHRQNIGWDKQADDALKIKDNKLPLDIPKKANEKYYVDNWILKSVNWILSMLCGADINVQLNAIDGSYNKSMQLMSCEVNFLIDIFRWLDQGEKAVSDRYWTGIGVTKNGWNVKKLDKDFQTGVPVFQYIDSRKIFLDSNPHNMKYICHLEVLNKEDILNYFPEYPELKRLDRKQANLYIVQVKETKTKKQIALYIEDRDDIQYFDYEEFQQELANGFILPEGVIASNPILSEYDQVTEYLYLEEEKRILKSYDIGPDFTYNILKGEQMTDSPYSFGLPYYLKDMQELSIILMNILTMTTLKHHKPIRIVYPEAIKDYNSIKNMLHLPGVDIQIEKDWEMMNPDKKPIEFIDPPKFNQELEFLEQKIAQVIKSTTGVTDTLQGSPEYAQMSGVAVAQFQTAAKVIHKKDFIHWSRFIQDNVKSLMALIEKYRNYPHQIMGLNDNDITALVDVATDNENELRNANYNIIVQIDENQDAIKQMERDLILRLHQMGLVSDEDVLEKMPFKNIDRLIDNLKNRKQQQAIIQQQQMQMQQQSPSVGATLAVDH